MKKTKKAVSLILAFAMALIAMLGCMTISSSAAESAGQQANSIGNGNELYRPLKITGNLMPEEQIFSTSDITAIENEKSLGLTKTRVRNIGGSDITVQGLDLAEFLILCGVERSAGEGAVIQLFADNTDLPEKTVSMADIMQYGTEAILEPGGSVYLSDLIISNVKKILVSTPDNLADPYYGLHLREPLDYMQDIKFTVNFIDKGRYTAADENAEAFKTITYTMKEIEKMMTEHPEQVFGNYFGVSGNEESKTTLGLGGFSDYFEGISMSWLLSEKAGLKDGEGFAVFYGRDNDQFGIVKNLHYFFPKNGDYSKYYLELTDTFSVDHAVPVLAVSKNGYPLLPEHNHEMEGNVDYNTFTDNAKAKGFETKIGIVKNVSGPFIAALSNLDGSYGGYRNETSGDCVRIDLYVDASQYPDDGNGKDPGSNGGQNGGGKYADVSADSWYAEYVNYLSEKGIVNGKTSSLFEPQAPVTRAEFVKMIAGLAGADVSAYTGSVSLTGKVYSVSQFNDVKSDFWYAPYVLWAVQNGIVRGISDTQFNPDGNITRQDMAVILARFADFAQIELSDTAEAAAFSDDASIASYARSAVSAMQKAGIISGKDDGRFDPRESAARSEACKMLTILAKQMESRE